MKNPFREEKALILGVVTAAFFFTLGKGWLADLSAHFQTTILFLWLFGAMLWLSFSVVKHADCLAIKLGEPYGTLILTLAVISIEVIMISAVMITGSKNPTLGRDMMFAVVMIVLNGLVGLSLLLGGKKHVEQTFNLQGANAFLGVLIPLAVLGLILPNFTQSTDTPTFSPPQAVFLILTTLGLYGVFLAMQTMRHQDYFRAPQPQGDEDADGGHGDLVLHSVPYHSALLLGNMLPIVLLSKSLAQIVDYSIASAGAPAALGGMLVAVLVLSPEGMAAIKSALENRLQRSINICLGSALATIGLTVPAVLIIGMIAGKTVVLGLNGVDSVMLLLTLAVSVVHFSSKRSNLIQGLVHLILFAAYLMLIFDGM